MRKNVDAFVDWMIKVEKANYHNDVVSFAEHAEKVKFETEKFFTQFQERLAKAKKLIQQTFEAEEAANPAIADDAKFTVWEKAAAAIQEKLRFSDTEISKEMVSKSIQEYFSIPLSFMQRVYKTAQKAYNEKRFEEAESYYFFLSFLCPQVFEYKLGQAASQQAQGNFLEAMKNYAMLLLIQPSNPLACFQMAACSFRLGEKQAAIEILDQCILYCKEDDKYKELLKAAEDFKAAIEAK